MNEPVWIEAADVYAFHLEMLSMFGHTFVTPLTGFDRNYRFTFEVRVDVDV